MIYEISIKLLCQGKLIHHGAFSYFNSGIKKDLVSFTKECISIRAERNKRYDEDTIFMNVQNSLYNQIYKCLLIHFCSNTSNAGIREIIVNEVKKGETKVLYKRSFSKGSQPLPVFPVPLRFSDDTLKILLNEDDDSFKLRIIIAHWLSQGAANDRLRRLECSWRTFERICDYMRHKPMGVRSNIAEGLDLLVNEIVSHKGRYIHSSNMVNTMTFDELRAFRWREMVENNYPKLRRGSNFESNYINFKKRLVDPYKDERVCRLVSELIKYRKNELDEYDLKEEIEDTLATNLSKHIQSDIDVVALMCHYAYYLRNRLFHGQSLIRGSIFDIHKLDNMKIEEITRLLNTLIVELLNNFKSL